jgi:hypothetical protein
LRPHRYRAMIIKGDYYKNLANIGIKEEEEKALVRHRCRAIPIYYTMLWLDTQQRDANPKGT